MEFIEECLTSIDFEWRSKVRSLLVPECLVDPHCWDDSDFVGYGVVTSVSHHFDCAHDIWNCICCHQQASYWWWVDRISGFEFWILGPKRICQTFERQLVWLPEGTHRQGRWERWRLFRKEKFPWTALASQKTVTFGSWCRVWSTGEQRPKTLLLCCISWMNSYPVKWESYFINHYLVGGFKYV